MKKTTAIAKLPFASLACMLGLIACTAPPPRSQVQESNLSPILTSTPDVPTHTATPSPAPTSAAPAGKANPAGLWDYDRWMTYDLRADGTISASKNYADYTGENPYSGEWRTLQNGRIYMTVDSMGEMIGTLHGNVLVGEAQDLNLTALLRRMDAQGNTMPTNITTSAVPLPLFDPTKATALKIEETWWGLSPDAPIASQITLTLGSDSAFGAAFFSKGSFEPVSTTASITIPMNVMTKMLEALSQTPMVDDLYRPYITHTDDYPYVRIMLALPEGNVIFETRSQGQDNLPWQVIVNGQEYVTFSDLPSSALQLLDPYLAHK